MAKKSDQAFESKLEDLEKIVTELESGELPLDKGLELFEQGVLLYKDCKKQLEKVEKKINKLTESLEEEPIEE